MESQGPDLVQGPKQPRSQGLSSSFPLEDERPWERGWVQVQMTRMKARNLSRTLNQIGIQNTLKETEEISD